MARVTSRTYNPATGKWEKNYDKPEKTDTTKTPKGTDKEDDNLTSTSTDTDDSTGSAEKKYNTIELNTLQGSLAYIPTNETIKIKAGDTIRIQGIGNYLSGKYYVQEVVRSFNSSGYSQSATVIKTDFGSSLKKKKKIKKKVSKTKTKTENSTGTVKGLHKTYTVKKGDTLFSIAKKYYKDGSKWKKIYNANKSKTSAKSKSKLKVGIKLIIP